MSSHSFGQRLDFAAFKGIRATRSRSTDSDRGIGKQLDEGGVLSHQQQVRILFDLSKLVCTVLQSSTQLTHRLRETVHGSMDLSDLETHPFIPASSLHFASHGPDPFENPRVGCQSDSVFTGCFGVLFFCGSRRYPVSRGRRGFGDRVSALGDSISAISCVCRPCKRWCRDCSAPEQNSGPVDRPVDRPVAPAAGCLETARRPPTGSIAVGHDPPSSRPAGRNQWPPPTSFGQCKDWPAAQASGTASWEQKAPGSGGSVRCPGGPEGHGSPPLQPMPRLPPLRPAKIRTNTRGEIILFTPKSGDDPDERSFPYGRVSPGLSEVDSAGSSSPLLSSSGTLFCFSRPPPKMPRNLRNMPRRGLL